MNGIQHGAPTISKSCRKEFQCPQCYDSFRFRRHYDKHLLGHKHNNCKYCDKLFTVRKKLVVHLLEEHGIILKEFKYNCQICEKVFAKRLSLYQHFQVHAVGKNVCLQCGIIFSDDSEFMKHQEKHNVEKFWKCEECDEKFSRRQQYMTHIQDHGKYRCLTCNKRFSALAKLSEHKRNGHKISELLPEYVCLKCNRSFHRRRALVLHQRVHQGKTSEKNHGFGNNVLDKVSQSKEIDDDHLIGIKERVNQKKEIENVKNESVNVMKKKYGSEIQKVQAQDEKEAEKCIYCDYQSSSKANLKRHLEFHTEERKFICESCGASFYMLSTLKEHFLYVHSEKRNFPCPQCDKSFKRKSGLNRHLHDHSGSRPFACHCGQFYKRKSHLLRHQESSHGLVSQSRKLCKLKRNESGILVPIKDELLFESKNEKSRLPNNIDDGSVTDETYKYINFKEKDLSSNGKDHGNILSNHCLKTLMSSENYEVNKKVMKEHSVNKSKNCDRNDGVGIISDGVVDSSGAHSLLENIKALSERVKYELIKKTVPQNPIYSGQSNLLQNIGVVVEDQVISYPLSCTIDFLQDPADEVSTIDLVQIAPNNILSTGVNTIFLCLSSNVNHDENVGNIHDMLG